jgi:hypothetical protein
MTKYQGQITRGTGEGFFSDKLVVDAEPHVMQRIRKIFDNSQNYYNSGKYTHKPILFPITLSACRDLIWVMERYVLECSSDILETIQAKANEYDIIVKTVSNAC